MKKRILSLLTLAVMLLTMVPCTCSVAEVLATDRATDAAATESVTTKAENGALDLVILLDNSGSMYKDGGGNDTDAFRYDAASIMLNMCEVSGSRAVVYQFRGKKDINLDISPVFGKEELQSLDIDRVNYLRGNYRSLVTKELTKIAIEAMGMPVNNGSTPLGEALKKAVEVLDRGKDDRNGRQPLILILADGADTSEESERLNALADCKDKGYKIYTVMLGQDFSNEDRVRLQSLAEGTDGRYFELTNASELPLYFSKVLADQTGAELTSEKMIPQDMGEGLREIIINVPNRSVQECNIMIPMIGLTDVKLTRPDTKEVIPYSDEKLFYFEVGGTSKDEKKNTVRFAQYKIMNPDDENTELGKWNLSFRAATKEDADQVSVTVIYNYDLTLRTNLDDGISAGKNEKITLEAQFHTPDGKPSTDDMLYRPRTEDDPGIVVKAYLFSENQEINFDSENYLPLKANKNGKKFALEFSYDDFPNITRKEGTYTLIIRATGDGLIRTSEPIPYEVKNSAPQAKTNVASVEMTIDNPFGENDAAKEILLTDLVEDPDLNQDIDWENWSVASSNEAVVTVEPEGTTIDTAKLKLKAIGTDGKDGKATVTVTVQDVDGATANADVAVNVKSILQYVDEEYTFELADSASTGENKVYQRGDKVELKASAKPNVQIPTFPIGDNYRIETFFVGKNETGTGMYEQLSKDAAVTTVTLNRNIPEYKYEARLYVGNNEKPLKTATCVLAVSNVEPRVKEGFDLVPDTANIGCDKAPNSWLGQENTEAWNVMFEDMFYDPNENDTLTFEIVSAEGEAAKVDRITAENSDALIGFTITPVAEGELKVQVKATDDSSEKSYIEATYTVSVIDRNRITVEFCQKVLLALAAAIVLVIIIHEIARPKFKNVALDVYHDNIPQKKYRLSSSIRKEKMSKFTVPNFPFTSAMASGLEIRPARGGAWIIIKNPSLLKNTNAEIKVNGKKLGGKLKKALLKKSVGEMTATVNGATMSWKLVADINVNNNRRALGSGRSGRSTRTNTTGRPSTGSGR